MNISDDIFRYTFNFCTLTDYNNTKVVNKKTYTIKLNNKLKINLYKNELTNHFTNKLTQVILYISNGNDIDYKKIYNDLINYDYDLIYTLIKGIITFSIENKDNTSKLKLFLTRLLEYHHLNTRTVFKFAEKQRFIYLKNQLLYDYSDRNFINDCFSKYENLL